jgi:hypothetical protein
LPLLLLWQCPAPQGQAGDCTFDAFPMKKRFEDISIIAALHDISSHIIIVRIFNSSYGSCSKFKRKDLLLPTRPVITLVFS